MGPFGENAIGGSGALAVEALARRDKVIVGCGLAVVFGLSAAYTLAGVGMPMSAIEMTQMASKPAMMSMSGPASWSAGYAILMFLMWWIMMVAMMLPSAAPAILTYTSAIRRNRNELRAGLKAFSFAFGYLFAWGVFSAVATWLQWSLQAASLLSPMMSLSAPEFAGTVLVVAGLYQLSPLKQACLRHCQHPLVFFLSNWRPGTGGAIRMGARHGLFCLGCCWFLMALLFVGGIMNLFWIGALAIYVALEKVTAHSQLVTYSGSAAMIGAGSWMIWFAA